MIYFLVYICKGVNVFKKILLTLIFAPILFSCSDDSTSPYNPTEDIITSKKYKNISVEVSNISIEYAITEKGFNDQRGHYADSAAQFRNENVVLNKTLNPLEVTYSGGEMKYYNYDSFTSGARTTIKIYSFAIYFDFTRKRIDSLRIYDSYSQNNKPITGAHNEDANIVFANLNGLTFSIEADSSLLFTAVGLDAERFHLSSGKPEKSHFTANDGSGEMRYYDKLNSGRFRFNDSTKVTVKIW